MEREECLKYFLGNKKFTKIHIFRACEDKMLFSFRCNRAKRTVQTFWVSYTISLAFKYRYIILNFIRVSLMLLCFSQTRLLFLKIVSLECVKWEIS